jgi:hypothetical protein
MTQIFDGQLRVQYHQAYVQTDGADLVEHLPDAFRGQINGLCGAAIPGNLVLITGLHTGWVNFTVDVLDTSPILDDTWEEIVEAFFMPAPGETLLLDWDGNTACTIPLLSAAYRVRYCARNMDVGREVDTLVKCEPVDSYALLFWLAEQTSDSVIKQTSQEAANCHREAQTSF